jgi:hypothetical protein
MVTCSIQNCVMFSFECVCLERDFSVVRRVSSMKDAALRVCEKQESVQRMPFLRQLSIGSTFIREIGKNSSKKSFCNIIVLCGVEIEISSLGSPLGMRVSVSCPSNLQFLLSSRLAQKTVHLRKEWPTRTPTSFSFFQFFA